MSPSETSLTWRLAQPHKLRNEEVKQQDGRGLDWGGREEEGTENREPTLWGKRREERTDGSSGRTSNRKKKSSPASKTVNKRGSGDELVDG